MAFVGIVSVIFVDIVFVTFVDTLSIVSKISSQTQKDKQFFLNTYNSHKFIW